MQQTFLRKRSLARYIAALFNRCSGWVASLHETLPEVQVMVRSPSGTAYVLCVHLEGSVDKLVVEGLAQVLTPGQAGVIVCASGRYTREAAELARRRNILTWSLSQLDYLTMAAELEISAPLAYVGLEVEQPKYVVEAERLSKVTGGFHV